MRADHRWFSEKLRLLTSTMNKDSKDKTASSSGAKGNAWQDYEDGEVFAETKTDSNGIKERTRIGLNREGKKVKIVTKLKVTEVAIKAPKRIQNRKDLPRFGEAKEGEQNVTLLSKETVAMEHPDDALVEDKDTALASTLSEFIKRQSGRALANDAGLNLDDLGDNIFPSLGGSSSAASEGPSGGDARKESGEPAVKKYVPPSVLNQSAGSMMPGVGGAASAFGDRDQTIRVSNLTKDVDEDDLRELFGRFGRINRVALPKAERVETDKDGRQTVYKEPRGFAYITFMSMTDAESAFERLQGYGYANLILKLEWSKPIVRTDGPPGGGGGEFRSGYGTKLAQDTKEKVHGYADQAANNRAFGGGGGGGQPGGANHWSRG